MERRLAGAADIGDLRAIARRHTPRAVFDYVDGAAETETSLRRSRGAFARVEFVPRVLRDVATVDPSTTILGRRAALPLVVRPDRLHPPHASRGGSGGRPRGRADRYPVRPLDDGHDVARGLAAAAPGTQRWFQLYLWRDRDASIALIERARAAGFAALMLTVDTPVAGARLRDVRNGFSIPPALTLKTLADIALHPGWWFDKLTTEPLTFASMGTWNGTVAEMIDKMFDPTLDLGDLAWLRGIWRVRCWSRGSRLSRTPEPSWTSGSMGSSSRTTAGAN